jgi:hypothetical protein
VPNQEGEEPHRMKVWDRADLGRLPILLPKKKNSTVNTRRSDNFNGRGNMSQHVTTSKRCLIRVDPKAAIRRRWLRRGKYGLKWTRKNWSERSEKRTRFGGTGWKGTSIKMAAALENLAVKVEKSFIKQSKSSISRIQAWLQELQSFM